ncbi:hypothetical protein CSOJ01_09511 [Colletotrichum sojae]|uniref:Uncharacterized protein n=1 Tax=Colletotrichum sojae TaxID=2175907 RepID=A0A8H6J3J0_9PEZI|nr:hypothetical protein CSOJ01_09511 [Colletotrichum sojae]
MAPDGQIDARLLPEHTLRPRGARRRAGGPAGPAGLVPGPGAVRAAHGGAYIAARALSVAYYGTPDMHFRGTQVLGPICKQRGRAWFGGDRRCVRCRPAGPSWGYQDRVLPGPVCDEPQGRGRGGCGHRGYGPRPRPYRSTWKSTPATAGYRVSTAMQA